MPDSSKRPASDRLLVGYGGLTLATVLLAILAALRPHFAWDLPLARWIQSPDSPLLRTSMAAVSFQGSRLMVIATVPVAALLFAAFRRWRMGIFLFLILPLDQLSEFLKVLVHRPRPAAELVRVLEAHSSTLSFPSGHVVHTVLLAGFLLWLVSTELSRKPLRLALQVLLVAVLVLVGVSRVYLGAHWPSDVLGGYLVGTLLLGPLVALYRQARRRGLLD